MVLGVSTDLVVLQMAIHSFVADSPDLAAGIDCTLDVPHIATYLDVVAVDDHKRFHLGTVCSVAVRIHPAVAENTDKDKPVSEVDAITPLVEAADHIAENHAGLLFDIEEFDSDFFHEYSTEEMPARSEDSALKLGEHLVVQYCCSVPLLHWVAYCSHRCLAYILVLHTAAVFVSDPDSEEASPGLQFGADLVDEIAASPRSYLVEIVQTFQVGGLLPYPTDWMDSVGEVNSSRVARKRRFQHRYSNFDHRRRFYQTERSSLVLRATDLLQ